MGLAEVVPPSSFAANIPPPPEQPEPGVVREEYMIPVKVTPVGSRARGLPNRVPPPLEEGVIYTDSLNGLSIGNQGNWTHLDNSARPTAWHLDSLYSCTGRAWWCGRVDSSWTFDSNRRGYENNWLQFLTNGAWLDSLPGTGPVTIGFRHHLNIEPNYDYAALQVFDPEEGWRSLAVFTGKVPSPNNTACDTVTYTIPDSLIQQFYGSVNRDIHPRFPFRFVFTSDIAYSSQDGLYDGDGWTIDNVTVKKGATVRFFDNCESGPGTWDASIFPPVGDFFSISSNVFTEDICTENRTNVWSDWDPSTQSVIPRMDNLLRTPSVFINRPTQSFVLFDVYRNLPLNACFYYHLRFRTRNAGDVNWSEWVDPTRLIYYGGSKDWARQKVVLPGAEGKDSLQVEFALTDYAQIYCGGVGNANGVYTFFDNVAVGVTAMGPPAFIQRDIDLFQDTFQTTPFFKDDNVNTALGDSAVIEVTTASGYKTGSMFWRRNGGSWNSTPLLPAATALPKLRYGDLPAGSMPANSLIEYYFTVTDNSDSTGWLPAGAKNGSAYFTVSILPLKTAINPTLGCFDSLATILMVNNNYGREPKNLLADALKGQGYKLDVWDVNGPTSGIGNTPGGSDPAGFYDWPATGVTTLLQYSTIIWHAGSLSAFTLSKEDQALIQSWIQQPGKNRNLWIAGDNVAYDLAGGREYNSFLSFTGGMRYLRDSWENFPQDTLHPVVTGTLGDDAAGRAFHVNGDCPIIDKLDMLATYPPAGGSGKIGVLLKYPNNQAAATRYATRYVSFGTDSARVVFQGFNWSNIEEGGERLQLAKNILFDYFQVPACYTPTSVEIDPGAEAPVIRNALAQNAPNPFNPVTTIAYSIAQTGPVTIRIYNAGGALVRTLVDKPHAPGTYSVRWDGKDGSGLRLASGVYFYKIETGAGFRDSKKLILLK